MSDQTEDRASGSDALIYDLSTMRALVNAADTHAPELGHRTPQPTRQPPKGNTDLSMSDVAGILREMEEGRTKRGVELWLRMVKTDSHLASVWQTRIAPVASARWELSPGEGPARTVDAAMRLRDACEEALRGLGTLEPIFTRQLGAIGTSYSVSEIVWNRARLLDVGAWVPGGVVPIDGRRFAYADDYEIGLFDDNLAVPRLREGGWEVDAISGRAGLMARLPAGKYLVHQPASIDDYPPATGLVHPVARWWWAKQRVIVYWLGGAEIAANPRLIGRILQEASSDVAQGLMDGLEALAADGVIILRPGTDVEIRPGQGESSATVWLELAKFMDTAMSKAVLGSTLNVEISDAGGNRAAAESQAGSTIDPRMAQDGSQLWSTWRDQLFRFVRDYNPHLFAPDTPLPRGEFIYAEPPVEIDQTAIDAESVTYDELRVSRGLPPWGGSRGERVIHPGAARLPQAPAPAPEGLDVQSGDVQSAALNGAQVSAILEIVTKVTEGALPRQTAVELIISAFPIDRAQADRILGDVGRGFEPAPSTDAQAPEVAAAAVPFVRAAPWDLARARGRALLPGQAATQMSLPLLTTPSERKP